MKISKKIKNIDVSNKAVDREKKRKIAEHTLKYLDENKEISEKCVEKSFLFRDDEVCMDVKTGRFKTEVVVSCKTTLQALYELDENLCPKACILNFASAKNPGGKQRCTSDVF